MKKKVKKNVGKQKREVKQFKFSLLPEEEKLIVNEAKNFSSFSNFVRHHLGLRQLSVGRKKVNTQAAFVFEDEFLEQYLLEENIEIKKTKNVEKTETVKSLEEPILLQLNAKQNPKNDFNQNYFIQNDSNILELGTERNNPQTISNSTINIQTNSSNLNQLNSEKIENNDEQTKPTKSKTESPIPEEIIQRSLFEM